MFLGTILITIMYLGLTYSIAEMSPALPHTGGAYSFARTAFGPWGGFITGVAENIEYVLTPAVIVFFIGTYLTAIFQTPVAFQPLYWLLGYIIFVGSTCAASSCRSWSPLIDDPAGDHRARHLLRRRHSVLRFRPIRAEHRRRSGDRSGCGTAGGQRPVPAVRASTASSPRCHLRCGCFSPSSSCRSRRKNRSSQTATCQRASCTACSR